MEQVSTKTESPDFIDRRQSDLSDATNDRRQFRDGHRSDRPEGGGSIRNAGRPRSDQGTGAR